MSAVTLRPTFGADKSGTRRWTHTPTVSLFDASSQETQLLQEVLDDLNEPIAKTKLKKLTLGPPNNKKAEILVHFTLHKNLPALAKSVQFNNYEETMPAFTSVQGNNKYELVKATTALATDKLEGDRLRAQATAGMMGSLGFLNSSSKVKESVFAGGATKLAEIDRKLLVFFYNHIPPACDAAELIDAYKKHWPKCGPGNRRLGRGGRGRASSRLAAVTVQRAQPPARPDRRDRRGGTANPLPKPVDPNDSRLRIWFVVQSIAPDGSRLRSANSPRRKRMANSRSHGQRCEIEPHANVKQLVCDSEADPTRLRIGPTSAILPADARSSTAHLASSSTSGGCGGTE